MIYEKQIYENTALNGDVSYTGCCKIYSIRLFGIALFPETLYVAGSPFGRYFTIIKSHVRVFSEQIECDNALDKLIAEHKRDFNLLHPLKSERIL